MLQVTEEEFIAGFDSVYTALMPVVEWAADLPQGAFSNYENRGAIIEAGEHRAITLPQLLSLATLLKQVLEIREWTDDNKYSATHGKRISWEMINMYENYRSVSSVFTCVYL